MNEKIEIPVALSDLHVHFAKEIGFKAGNKQERRFLALALCGEVGELANLVKKAWRGDPEDIHAIIDEIADVQIYLYHLANSYNVNLTNAVQQKLNKLRHRWPERFTVEDKIDIHCPECGKSLEDAPGGGLQCSCGYWFCY